MCKIKKTLLYNKNPAYIPTKTAWEADPQLPNVQNTRPQGISGDSTI